jgi:two-component system LytT family response regulator
VVKAIIIDDENLWIELFSNLLGKHCPTVSVAGKFNNAAEGVAGIRQHQPDVVFTDIEMPCMNGFEMLRQFDEINFDVIFITAFDHYAVKAFKCSALDYLLKPVDPEELKAAINKVEQKKLRKATTDQMDIFLAVLKSRMSPVKKIALPSAEGITFVSPGKIIRCESDSNYTLFIMEDNQKILVAKTLKEAEEILQDSGFVRIHHSHLINPDYIDKYIRGDGGYVLMKDGSHITVSRSHREKFNEMFSRM